MSSNLLRKYIDILDEAVRLGYSDEYGTFRRPESQAERYHLAKQAQKVRAYNRGMRDYALDPTFDQPAQKTADLYNQFTTGVDSARFPDPEVPQGTGMLNPARPNERTDAVDTKDTSRKIPRTSRFDGRAYDKEYGLGSIGLKPRKRPSGIV
jgi:hypothetical protein